MVCARCGGEVWDNRTKKMDDPKWKTAADFSCKNKACGWKSGQPAEAAPPVATQAPPSVPRAAQPQGNGSRDAQLVRLYWDCFDEIIAGLKASNRMMASGFPAEQIAAMTSTLYIARSKVL